MTLRNNFMGLVHQPHYGPYHLSQMCLCPVVQSKETCCFLQKVCTVVQTNALKCLATPPPHLFCFYRNPYLGPNPLVSKSSLFTILAFIWRFCICCISFINYMFRKARRHKLAWQKILHQKRQNTKSKSKLTAK